MLHSPKRKAFTLIELLVVIAIIAILAAILFPVFAQAKRAAKKTVCLSGEKQIALGAIMYSNDFDDMLPQTDTCTYSPGYTSSTCAFWWYQEFEDYTTTPISHTYTDSGGLLQPYLKNSQIDGCPEATGQVPIGGPGGPPQGIAYNGLSEKAGPTSSFDAPASTIMLADQGILYGYPGAYKDYARPTFYVYCDPVNGSNLFPFLEGRHSGGTLNAAWYDGHAKSEKVGIGDLASRTSWWGAGGGDFPSYIEALQQHNVGYVFPPGVGSTYDPKIDCYYVPHAETAFGIAMTRPAGCPQ